MYFNTGFITIIFLISGDSDLVCRMNPTIVEYYHKLTSIVEENRKLILFIVFVALLLDNMLLTTVGKWASEKIFVYITR